MKRKRTAKSVKKNAKVDELLVINPNAAGIDVGVYHVKSLFYYFYVWMGVVIN